MALITEDGSGKADAESFASMADADTWHAARGNAAWALLSNGDKEVNLRKATDYIQQWYRSAWAGQRVTSTQALDWPRYDVPVKDLPGNYYPSNAVPVEVRTACILLALKASTAVLAPDLGSQKAKVKIGPIETEYVAGTRQTTKFQAVDNLLQPFFSGSGLMMKVVRA